MTAPKHVIAMHEARHLAACAVALVAAGVTRQAYECVLTMVHVSDHDGEAAIVPPDGVDVVKLAGHAAIGPLAERSDLIEKGIDRNDHDLLSRSDRDRIEASGESDFNLTVTCRAVQHLEAKLGETGFAALSRLVSRSSSACEGELSLHALLPVVPVREALHKARGELVEPPTITLTPEQNDRLSPTKRMGLGAKVKVTP